MTILFQLILYCLPLWIAFGPFEHAFLKLSTICSVLPIVLKCSPFEQLYNGNAFVINGRARPAIRFHNYLPRLGTVFEGSFLHIVLDHEVFTGGFCEGIFTVLW